jgi:imidazolonepropionase-like amidohydrolase
MDDPAFRNSIEYGVLYSCVLPGSGNIIGGMSAVIRNYGYDTNDAFIAPAGLKAAFGFNTMSPYSREKKGKRASTRMGCLAILRSEFYKITDRKKSDKLTAEQKVLKQVLDGKIKLRAHVHKSDDIAALLRIVDEFNLKITVEHACNVYRHETFAELAERGIPVIAGPVEGIGAKVELKDMAWRNLKTMIESGVKFGVMTDHDVNPQSNLFYVMRHFLRCGLSELDAVNTITRTNAEIIGVDNILGTLENGKWASFTCWNGNPFLMKSYPVKVFGEGRVLYED